MILADRFWSKVFKRGELECWSWQAARNHGYGVFGIGQKLFRAHRIAYELAVGPIPEGLEIDHVCHNRACVNPAHLRICMRSDNNKNLSKRSDNTSGLKGVYRRTKQGDWCAQIAVNGKSQHLGVFSTPEAAHQAYREAAQRLHGEFACFGEAS